MGTNLGEFLQEAHRVLKGSGRIKIAEVRSRFEGEYCTPQYARVHVNTSNVFSLLFIPKTLSVLPISYHFSRDRRICHYFNPFPIWF